MKLKDWKKKEFTATLAYTVSGADILAALDIPDECEFTEDEVLGYVRRHIRLEDLMRLGIEVKPKNPERP